MLLGANSILYWSIILVIVLLHVCVMCVIYVTKYVLYTILLPGNLVSPPLSKEFKEVMNVILVMFLLYICVKFVSFVQKYSGTILQLSKQTKGLGLLQQDKVR